jgi:hypothetical protein
MRKSHKIVMAFLALMLIAATSLFAQKDVDTEERFFPILSRNFPIFPVPALGSSIIFPIIRCIARIGRSAA